MKENGNFKIYVAPWILSAKDQVEIIGKTASGEEVTRKYVNIQPIEQDFGITVNHYTLGESKNCRDIWQ